MSVLNVLKDVKVFFSKIFEEITIDSGMFRIQTVLTTVLLLTFSLIITARQYVGSPIQCIVKGVPSDPVNTYCWATSTYTIPKIVSAAASSYSAKTSPKTAAKTTPKEFRPNHPYPGIAPDHGGSNNARVYHSYYQWVCFVLFFQGLLSYLPKWLWNHLEGGLISSLMAGMTRQQMLTTEERTAQKDRLLKYLIGYIKV